MELFLRMLELLPPNEQALSGRLACRDAAWRLSTPRHRTVRCDQPLPEHADDSCWHRHLSYQLPFKHKLQLLSTAAASGCEANVRLAWGVLQPCLFQEMIPDRVGTGYYPYGAYPNIDDPGTAAATAGHAGMVAWLVANGCPLDKQRTLVAAAKHCDLQGLQAVWGLVDQEATRAAGDSVPCAAAESCTPDACAKVSWLLQTRGVPLSCDGILAAAARVGNFDVVRHVVDTWRGLALGRVLLAALRRADLAVADWLVDEIGVVLPRGWADGQVRLWEAAAAGGSVPALRWLLGRGVPLPRAGRITLLLAARSGGLEAVRFLLDDCGLPWTALSIDVIQLASVELAAWLLQRGNLVLSPLLYSGAAWGTAAMVQWLLQEAHCPFDDATAHTVLSMWPCPQQDSSSRSSSSSGDRSRSAGSSGAARGLLRALQSLAEAGCRLGRLGEGVMEGLARHGDVELARWVVQQAGGGRWPEYAMRRIVEHWPEGGAPGSRLCDAVRMVLEGGGSPGSSRELEQAARRGDLEALRLLHGQGQLRLSREVWVEAAESGCEAVLEWLAAEGCRVGAGAGQDSYLAAAQRGDRGSLCALRRLGVPWGHRGVLRAAVDWGVAPQVVRWMVEEGAPWDGAAVAAAAEAARRQGHEATAAWLEQQGAARGGRGAGSEGGGSRGGKRRR